MDMWFNVCLFFLCVVRLPFERWAIELFALQKHKNTKKDEKNVSIRVCVCTEKMFESSCFVAITIKLILTGEKFHVCVCVRDGFTIWILFLSLTYINIIVLTK